VFAVSIPSGKGCFEGCGKTLLNCRSCYVRIRIGITPLSGTTSEEHMKQDVEAIAMKDFEADEVEAVVNLIQ
jgi:hypothetical protein